MRVYNVNILAVLLLSFSQHPYSRLLSSAGSWSSGSAAAGPRKQSARHGRTRRANEFCAFELRALDIKSLRRSEILEKRTRKNRNIFAWCQWVASPEHDLEFFCSAFSHEAPEPQDKLSVPRPAENTMAMICEAPLANLKSYAT